MLRLRFLALPVALTSCALAAAQVSTRVDVDSQGKPGVTGQSWSTSALSTDGRYVVYSSDAPNLLPADANGQATDVYLHDRATGVTELVSQNSSGVQGNSYSGWVSMSSDARFVVFDSLSTNLAGPTNGKEQIFLRDRQLGTTEMVSLSHLGQPGSLDSYGHSVTDDGRYVAFQSVAHFLDPVVPGAHNEMYVRDRQLGTTVCISKTPAGTPSNGLSGFVIGSRFITPDGRFVVFSSTATNLGPPDSTTAYDVYLHDNLTGDKTLVSQSLSGGAGNSDSFDASISDDGRYVAFASAASDLVPGDTNARQDIFVRDLLTLTTERVSLTSTGGQGTEQSKTPWISADGSTVGFITWSKLDPVADDNLEFDGYIRDRATGATVLMTQHIDLSSSTLGVYTCALSDDGRVFSFWGELSGVAPGDTLTNQPRHYVHDRDVSAPALSYCTAKTNSAGCAPAMSSAGFASIAGYDACFLVASKVLNNKFGLMFWGATPAAIPFHGGTLCVQPPLKRTPSVLSGGSASGTDCSGSYSFHWSQAHMAAQGHTAGQTFHAQWWQRDPGFAPPDNMGLSDAVQFQIAP